MRSLLLICLTLFTPFVSSYGLNPMEDIDQKLYYPTQNGLKDLFFEMRIDGLTKKINDSKSFGKVKDVHFKVYWSYMRGVHIEVEGIGERKESFIQLKGQLKLPVQQQMNLIVPLTYAKRYRKYNVTKSPGPSWSYFLSNSSAKGLFQKIKIDDRGRVSKIEASDSLSKNILDGFKYKEMDSKGSFLTSVQASKIQRQQEILSKTKVSYQEIRGIILANRIEVETEIVSIVGKDGKKERLNSDKITYRLSNFMVNQSTAVKMFKSLDSSMNKTEQIKK